MPERKKYPSRQLNSAFMLCVADTPKSTPILRVSRHHTEFARSTLKEGVGITMGEPHKIVQRGGPAPLLLLLLLLYMQRLK